MTNSLRIGTIILVEQDFADIFLPLAKMLRYAVVRCPAVMLVVLVLVVVLVLPCASNIPCSNHHHRHHYYHHHHH